MRTIEERSQGIEVEVHQDQQTATAWWGKAVRGQRKEGKHVAHHFNARAKGRGRLKDDN